MGVQSLYTSVPHQEGLRAVRFFLEQRPEPTPSTIKLLRLAEFIFILNNFSFNFSHSLQVRGVTMGTRMGPSYACLFVGGASEISTFFLNQALPSTVVDRTLNRVRSISYTSALTSSLPSCNSDRVPLVLTYHPTSI
eukprot:g27942.t1